MILNGDPATMETFKALLAALRDEVTTRLEAEDRALAAEARVTSLERQVKGLEESKADAERMLDAYDAPTRDDGDGGPLSIAGRIEAMAYVISLALTQSDGPGSTGKGS